MSLEWVSILLAGGSLAASLATVLIAWRILRSVKRTEQDDRERLEMLHEQQERLALMYQERQGLRDALDREHQELRDARDALDREQLVSNESERRHELTAASEKQEASSSGEAPAPIINLSGDGQMATEPFDLESGLAIFTMAYQGEGNFIVKLLDEDGAPVGGAIANEAGSFEGSNAAQTKAAGQHVLDVQARGPWTITIEQPRPSSAPETTSFSGDSTAITDFFQLPGGLTRFNLTHQGSSNFIVKLLDRDGAPVGGALVNEVGSFEGSKAVRVPEDGIYLLQVGADGPWTIQVEYAVIFTS